MIFYHCEEKCLETLILALSATGVAIKKATVRRQILVPRIIPLGRKTDGILPLIRIFAGLFA